MPFFAKSVGDDKARLQVRALIAYTFVLAIIYGFVMGMIATEVFMPVAIMAISWWFASREENKNV